MAEAHCNHPAGLARWNRERIAWWVDDDPRDCNARKDRHNEEQDQVSMGSRHACGLRSTTLIVFLGTWGTSKPMPS